MTTPQAQPQLYEQASVKLNGSGNGTAKLSPGQPGSPGSGVGAGRNSGYAWNVTGIAVSVATAVDEATAYAYISYGILSNGPGDLQGQSQTGSTGDTCTVNANLRPGDWVSVRWAGGDPNQIATMRVFGTVILPGG